MNNQELVTLFILTLSLLGVLTILLVYLVIRKVIHIRKRKLIESYKSKYSSTIYAMLMDGGLSRQITSGTEPQLKAIEELLNQYQKMVERDEEKQRLTKLAEMHLQAYYQKGLKSMRWSKRMNSLFHIEDFNISGLLNDLLKLLDKKRVSHEELIYIVRILATFQYPRLFNLITTRFNDFSEIEYRNILIRLEQDQFDQFVFHFHKSTFSLQKAILGVIAIKKEITYLSFIENIFSNYTGEIRLRALKALAEIGNVKEINPYMGLLYSPKWEERMMAAKLIGSVKEEKGITRLVELLHDQTWWVRFQAAQSICQFPKGKDILRSVLETSKDIFARDMAWEWLHKGD